MKTLRLHKALLTSAVGAALSLGIASNALAAPQFQVDPDSNPLTLNNFYATSINGGSSERLTITPGGVGVGNLSTTSGYMNFGSFDNAGPLGTTGTSLPAFMTGLGNSYQLYLTYNLVATLASGTVGTIGSTYNVTSLNFNVYRNDQMSLANLTNFTAATLASNATVTDNGLPDILLGSGSLLFPGSGVAGIDSHGGAFLNATTSYATTPAGDAFFVDPVPFYSLAFSAFNNTSQGVLIGTNAVAINAAGIVDFNRIPEPATLGLMGLGLLGLGASLRKGKSA